MNIADYQLDPQHQQLLDDRSIEEGSPAHHVALRRCTLGYAALNDVHAQMYDELVAPHITAIAARMSCAEQSREVDEE